MNQNTYTDLNNFKVFVITHPLSKEFFIHFSGAKTLNRIFSIHWSLHNQYTKKLFQTYRGTTYPPEIYLLEEKMLTTSQVYVRKLLWIRYFKEHKFSPLNDVLDVEAADDLYEENKKEYEIITALPLADVLSDANRRCVNYDIQRAKTAPGQIKKQKKQVKFFCEQEDYQLIEMIAKKNHRSVSAYLREVALQGFVLQIDFESIKEHTKQLSFIKNQLNAMIKLLVNTNQAYPKDIETILELLEQIKDSENALLATFRREQTTRTKKIRKMIKDNLKTEKE